jgi:bifunctional non-homologous end joining protein LigD
MSDRFVIQEHTRGGDTHWDLMLESGDCLKTWRLPVPPEKITAAPVEAIKILDHPLKFLAYQGPVNKGQGTVKIADKGVCTFEQTPDKIDLHLTGGQLKGHFRLRKLKGDDWQLQPL